MPSGITSTRLWHSCIFQLHFQCKRWELDTSNNALDWVFVFEKTWYMQWGDSFSPKLLGSNQRYLDEEYSYSPQGLISTMILLWQEQTLCWSPRCLVSVKLEEGRAESIKSAQQLAMMASRMISVRTLQHPAGTDGWSTWSAEAPSAWAAKHNDCFEISAASKGSSILPRHLAFRPST